MVYVDDKLRRRRRQHNNVWPVRTSLAEEAYGSSGNGREKREKAAAGKEVTLIVRLEAMSLGVRTK